MVPKQVLLVFLALAVSFALAGCHEEEKITRDVRPRVNDMKRVLGAIVAPDGKKGDGEQKTWFFKVVGADSDIEPLVDPFYQLIRSIDFDGDKPTWNVPEGWTEERGKDDDLRFATIYTGPKGKALELSVTALSGEKASSVGENVIRWRFRDLGLKDVLRDRRENPDVEDFYRYVPIGKDRLAVVVDMTGPGPRGNVPAMQEPAGAEEPFKYKLPEGWRKAPLAPLSILTFVASDMENSARITVSTAGGSLALNVNRWRDQLKLEPMSAEQIKTLPEIVVASTKGILVDITGPNAPPQTNRIVGAIVQHGDTALFFKMTGPADFVGKQKTAFENFLKSIQLGG